MYQVIAQYHNLLQQGFLVTLELLGSVMLIGVPLGIILGVVGGKYSPEFGVVIKAVRFFTKVVPVLVLLFWLHFPLQGLLKIVVNPFWTTILALSFVNTFAVAALITNELSLLPKSFRDSGITLGMSQRQIIWYIELPLLTRRALPQILLVQAAMLEYTLFASLIGTPELFRTAQTINAMIYQPVEIYTLLVGFFFAILAPLHLLISWIQKKYASQYA